MTNKVTSMKRMGAALLIAPLWVPVIAAIYTALFWAPPSFVGDADRSSWTSMAATAGALIGYAAMLVIGLPTHKILQSRNRRSAWAYVTLWLASAIVAWLIVFTVSFARYGLMSSFSYLADTMVHRPWVPLSFGVTWALVGATFWAIARPDREPFPAGNAS